ncbi:MAG: AAA family ATPase [Microthrixaceae bacterium]
MRIDRLDLTAYGPFTGRSLDLSHPGVHLVVGPNEAGKSTTLAAIGDALFGFPHSSSAGFAHRPSDLRLGMLIRRSDGRTIEFERIKKRSKNLLRPDGSVIDDDEFRQFLGALDRTVFETMYGIDHLRLRQGGASLLTGGGDLGQAILGAGSGTVNLPAALKALTEMAEQIFAPNARTRKLNAAINSYGDLLKEATSHALRPAQFSETHLDRERITKEVAQVRARKATIASERDVFKMLVNLFDRIGQRRIAVDRYSELEPGGRKLREGLAEQYEDLTAKVVELDSAGRRSSGQIEAITLRMAALSSDPDVITHRSALQRLSEQRAKYKSDVESLPGLRQNLTSVERSASDGLARLGMDVDLDNARAALTIPVAISARVMDFVEAEPQLRADEHSAQKLLDEAQGQLDTARRRLGALTDTPEHSRLTAGVKAIDGGVDLVASHRSTAASLRSSEAELGAATCDLGLGSVAPAEFLSLQTPPRAAVNEFRKSHDKLLATERRLKEQLDSTVATTADLRLQLEELLNGEDIPTVDELLASRSKRDGRWADVLAAWFGSNDREAGPDVPDVPDLDVADGDAAQTTSTPADGPTTDPGTLAGDYQSAVSESDMIADRLRQHAESVARRANLESQIAAHSSKERSIREQLESHAPKILESEKNWSEMWSPLGIHPGGPEEMSVWLDDHTKAATVAGRALEKSRELDALEAQSESHRTELSACLSGLGVDVPHETTLATILQLARSNLTAFAEQAKLRDELLGSVSQLEEELTSREVKHDKAAARLAKWESEWLEVSASTGFEGLQPNEAKTHLVEASEVLTALDAIAEINLRITGLEASVGDYEQAIRTIAAELGDEEAAGRDPLSILDRLGDRLADAEEVRIKHEELARTRSEVEDELLATRTDRQGAKETLNGLFSEASVTGEADLLEAIERSEQLREAQTAIDRLTAELSDEGGGRTADELEQMLADRDKSKLSLAFDERSAELEEIDGELETLNKRLGELNSELSRWDGSSETADRTTESQMVFSEIGALTEDYLAYQVAIELLRDHIASYREQNQGPILERATPWFKTMTAGSFERLEANYEVEDKPVLEAIRPDGTALVADKLSEGTRDQLYLALRLAAIAESSAAGGAYPIILDDLLMTFDDTRAAAALQVLGELCADSQILLFTHHQHLREIAESVIGSALNCHAL